MRGPIDRDDQLITQRFKADVHNGVDLRCVTDDTGVNLPVVTPEACVVLREGVDGYGNYFLVVRPQETDGYTELKFIHILPTNYRPGTVLKAGTPVSKCIIGGNSESLHLHFETWKKSGPVDPVKYFKQNKIKFGYKQGV